MMFDKPLLHFDQTTPDREKIVVRRNAVVERDYIEVDVLGCWGIRHARNGKFASSPLMYDDDGCPVHEKVYGKFTLERATTPPTAPAEQGYDDNDYFYGINFTP